MSIDDKHLDLLDGETRIFHRIYQTIWNNKKPSDSVQHAFRYAVVETAIQICHETGDEDSYVQFCVETIQEWLKKEHE